MIIERKWLHMKYPVTKNLHLKLLQVNIFKNVA